MGRDLSQDPAVRTGRPCAHPKCGRLHRNATYCSIRCRNAAWWGEGQAVRDAIGKRMRRAQQQQAIDRMITRCKVFADTEDERLVLAWRYGLSAARHRRYREALKAKRGRHAA